MKIAFGLHLSLAYLGGGERWAQKTAQALAASGHEVEVHAYPYSRGRRGACDPRALIPDIPYCEGWRHQMDADVVYLFYHPFCRISFPSDAPLVAGLHTQLYFLERPPPFEYGPVSILAYWCFRLFARRDLERFVLVHRLHDAIRVPHPRVVTVPNFVDASIFRPFNGKEERFTVLLVGKSTWQKGWDLAVETVERFAKDREVDVVWAGGEAHGRIKGLGFISSEREMARTYSRAHVLLYPSRVDMFSLSILEALACGTPVVTTDIPTHRGLDLPLRFGTDPSSLAAHLEDLERMWKEDTGEYSALCRTCTGAALNYSIENIIPRIERMLSSVVSG